MKRFSALLLLWLCVICGLQGQSTKQDSLLLRFENRNLPDSVRFESGLALAQFKMRFSADNSRAFAKRLLEFTLSKENKTWEADAIKWIGITHTQQGQFPKAHDYFFKNYELVKELNDQRGIAIILGNIGAVYYEMGNYSQAQDYVLKSLKLAEKINEEPIISRALNNLGNIHNDLKDYDTSLDYYQKSLAIKEKIGLKTSLPLVHNNIGLIHSQLNDHQLASASFNESVRLSKEVNDLSSEARGYSNLGVEFAKTNNFNKALEYLNKSIAIKTQINDKDGLASGLAYRGQTYVEMSRYSAARDDCLKALEISVVFKTTNLQKTVCACLSAAYKGLGDYKTSLKYHERFTQLKDTLFNKERTQEITRAEMNYQFEKQQLADSINFHKQQTAQQVAYEQKLNRQNTKFYILLIASLFIIGFLTFLYYKYHQNLKLKKVENQLLNSEIEFKKKDLTTMAVNISNNQEWAASLAERLRTIKVSTGRKRQKEFEFLEEEIKNKVWVNKDSGDFYKKVDELSSSFYARLNQQFEGLTKTEVRLCSFIKLNLNTKQIATLQNINPSSVKMSRNRLRKKLRLSPEDDLSAFLRTL
ncbi:tetratricopeptide repeat protein [Croceitalea rosinachiae]|uniref:Tetratricopeptide repeat protein n=1 Tax=Croceitalea rosinachiae TaxID=3075596 RepID=A0ABU3AAE4_9FLAO|nr:tetratricopeptide repeat protein [Croceitalea sp. F388]MDT0606858.1 tetratricopeptide repeat protein [Croceitalea sp. F388]